MADVKISQLPAATTPLAGTEEVPLVQSGETRKTTVDDIAAAVDVGVTSVTGTAPVVSSGGATPAISMAAANSSTDGYLTSTDWNTFNNKGSGTVTSVTGTAPVVSSGGSTPAISMAAANTTTNGYLTSTDWNTFNGKIGTLTSTDGSVTVSGTGASRDLSVAYATDVVVLVRNSTGSTLSKGTVVYISGATGQTPTVSKAIASGDPTSAQTLGLVRADIANNATGYVVVTGLITNIDTSAYADGAQLYLSPTTAGMFTTTKPYAPNHLVYVGIVEYSNAANGKIFVNVQNGYELEELHNVSAQTPSNGQTIVYNSSTQLWEATQLGLTNGVTGVLPIANGGNGTATPALTAGTNVTITGTWPNYTIAASGGSGGGDVSGPASSTDNAIARFDGTTGKLIQNSGMQVNDSGEVSVGVWKGTEIGISYGGTGAATAIQARGNLLPSYTSNAGKVLAVNTGATDVEWVSAGGSGTVTSVALSMPSGFSVSGSPITAAGTLSVTTAINGVVYGDGTGLAAATIGTGLSFSAGTLSNTSPMTYPGAGIAVSTGSAWTTSLTAPSGAIVGDTDTQTLTNKTISGSSNTLSNIGNASLTNSSVTVNGTAISLGGSGTVTATATNALTIGTGLSGTSYNGSTAVTIAIDSTVATLSGTQTLTNKTISGASNTLSNIGNASLTNSSITVNGTAISLGASGTVTVPISTGVTGLGSNVATFLATPSSANLAAAVTDETGSGSLVFGTSPTLTNPTITNYTETAYSANSSTAITLALTNGTVQIITLTGNATITMPTATAGKSFIMYLKQDATGSRTVTWSTVKWPGGTAPTITSTASKMDIYSFFSDGTNWYGVTVSQNYTP